MIINREDQSSSASLSDEEDLERQEPDQDSKLKSSKVTSQTLCNKFLFSKCMKNKITLIFDKVKYKVNKNKTNVEKERNQALSQINKNIMQYIKMFKV